ncbi:hypothetical protein GCM10007939_19830 [Amylibacter marinus]|uniref:CENP-V/GFA domain-containing protein n=1 Tax=Amylibacter marinus TaxID=1475483 RepID=A0ABQ5VWH0_9RHOB|nr:GFA family protein [Amylibacter marinus]GLQ35700.1 hypothetical protein GCM10007939_19830 [Amylibacter marinus]
MKEYNGSCECGEVQFSVQEQPKEITACHCWQCRKISGHFAAWAAVPLDGLEITGDEALRWYQSTDRAKTGFCSICGTTLFWRLEGRDETSIAAGAFEDALEAKLSKHVFVSEKADYYEIADDLPQAPQFDVDDDPQPI